MDGRCGATKRRLLIAVDPSGGGGRGGRSGYFVNASFLKGPFILCSSTLSQQVPLRAETREFEFEFDLFSFVFFRLAALKVSHSPLRLHPRTFRHRITRSCALQSYYYKRRLQDGEEKLKVSSRVFFLCSRP
jgi:hypothetical protein